MGNLDELKKEIKSQIDVVKNINDTPQKFIDSQKDKLEGKLSSFKPFGAKTFDSFIPKKATKKETHNDVFSDLIDTVEGFLGVAKKTNIDVKNKAFSKQRLRQIAEESVSATVRSSKTIVLDSISQILFAGDGICGTKKSFTSDNITIAPGEFDFMNILTVDPTSNTGQILYEDPTINPDTIKMNNILYSAFTTSQTVKTKDGNVLFNLNWDSNNQQYNISGLQGVDPLNVPTQIQNFISDYYSNIHFVDYNSVVNKAILMTIKGDGSEPPLFNIGLNDLNRLLSKICGNCGNPNTGLKQNPNQQFNENDEEPEFYFDFNDVEGIDLDDEANRLERVLKFTDCNDFKIPINPTHFEDFVYFKNKNINDNVYKTLYNVAADAHSQTNDTIPVDNFYISLLNSYILQLPKALMGTVLSPKYFLPIVIIYKQLVSFGGNAITEVKILMSKMSKLFKLILDKLMWKFLSEVWIRIKKDLGEFLALLGLTIVKNKYKKYVLIIGSLIAILNKVLQNLGDVDNCSTLFNTIQKSIQLALLGGVSIPIPSPLLLAAASRDGYSADRAHMNAMEAIKGAGIDTGAKFGIPSQIGSMVKGIIDGHTKEHDTNAKVSVFGLNPLAGPSFGISH
jgi:hypothetical protein